MLGPLSPAYSVAEPYALVDPGPDHLPLKLLLSPSSTPPLPNNAHHQQSPSLTPQHLLHHLDKVSLWALADLWLPLEDAQRAAQRFRVRADTPHPPEAKLADRVGVVDRKRMWPLGLLGISLNPARAARALLVRDPVAIPGVRYVGPRTAGRPADSNSLRPHDLLAEAGDPACLLRWELRWLAQILPKLLPAAVDVFAQAFRGNAAEPRISLRYIELASDWTNSHRPQVETALRSLGRHVPRVGDFGAGWEGHIRVRGAARTPAMNSATVRVYAKDPRYEIACGYAVGPAAFPASSPPLNLAVGPATRESGAPPATPTHIQSRSGAEPVADPRITTPTFIQHEEVSAKTIDGWLNANVRPRMGVKPVTKWTPVSATSTSVLAPCSPAPPSFSTADSPEVDLGDTGAKPVDHFSPAPDHVIRVETRFDRRAIDRELRRHRGRRTLLKWANLERHGEAGATKMALRRLSRIVTILRNVTEPLDKVISSDWEPGSGQIGELLFALTGPGGLVLFGELLFTGRIRSGPVPNLPHVRIGPRHLARARQADIVIPTDVRGVYELHPRFEYVRRAVLERFDRHYLAADLCIRLLALELSQQQLRTLIDTLGRGDTLPRTLLQRVGKLQRHGMVGRTGRVTTKWADDFSELRAHLQYCDYLQTPEAKQFAAELNAPKSSEQQAELRAAVAASTFIAADLLKQRQASKPAAPAVPPSPTAIRPRARVRPAPRTTRSRTVIRPRWAASPRAVRALCQDECRGVSLRARGPPRGRVRPSSTMRSWLMQSGSRPKRSPSLRFSRQAPSGAGQPAPPWG